MGSWCSRGCSAPMAGVVLAVALAMPGGATPADAVGRQGDAALPVAAGAWPSLEEQLLADHVAAGSALAKLIAGNQDLGLLRREESADSLQLPPWLRVLWRKHHPNDRYLASDPTGGYPRLLRDLHRWMVAHQDLQPGSPPSADKASGPGLTDRSASNGGEVRVSAVSKEARYGPTIRLNRWNPRQMLAASRSTVANTQVEAFVSGDGGASWGPVIRYGGSQFEADPAVDWTSDGASWFVDVSVQWPDATLKIQSLSSTDGGLTFWQYRGSDLSGAYTNNEDPVMWVDHSAASPFKDHVYVTWHQGSPAVVARRTGGLTGSWQTAVQISGAETTGTAAGGDVKTNGYGDVFGFYPDTGSRGLYVARSIDGGASYGSPVKITTTFGAYEIAVPAHQFVLIYATAGAYRTASVNDVYVAWNDLSGDPGCTSGAGPGTNASSTCKSRIFFSRSTDGGASWSAPVKVNDLAGLDDQFFPAMLVDEASGRIALTYYDTVGDSTRASTNLYYQSSTDGGASWSAPLKVTSASTNETTAGAYGVQYGWRTGIDGIDGRYFPAWTDRRGGGHEEIWTAAIADGAPACTPPPAPTGLAVVAGGQHRLNLSWSSAPGATQYTIYRSADSAGPFPAGPFLPVGTSTGTVFTDAGPSCGTAYSYTVTAGNGTCASAESVPARVSTDSCGCADPLVLYTNDFESGSGLSDWTISSGANDWRGIQTCTAYSGSHIFRFGGSDCSSHYRPNQAQTADVPNVHVPSLSTNTTLSFWHRWDFPDASDGGAVDLFINNVSFGTPVPPAAFLSGGYNGTLGGSCPIESPGRAVFTGTQGTFVHSVLDLDAACTAKLGTNWPYGCRGQDIGIFFWGLTGCAGMGTGWFLDDVTVTVCPQGQPLGFYTVAPCRVLDTRADRPLAPGTARFQVSGRCGIPVSARAVSANLTVVQPQAAGHLTVYPGDGQLPPTSNVNFGPGQVRANSAILQLAGDGSGTVNVSAVTSGGVHLVLDVNGYYQ
jgi:hypothetical protein